MNDFPYHLFNKYFFSIADVPDDRLLVLNTVDKIAYTHTHTYGMLIELPI